VVSGVEALKAQAEKSEKETERLRRALLDFEARVLVQEEAGEVLVKALPGKSVEELRYLARAAAVVRDKPVVLFVREPRFTAVIARGAAQDFDACAVAARLAAALGVRGGGSPEMAQIGGREALPGDDATLTAEIRRLVADL
jgi:alanyl-tRNA synthetase